MGSGQLIYSAARNENVGGIGSQSSVQYLGTIIDYCGLPSNTSICPGFIGVANRPQLIKPLKENKTTVFPNPSPGEFNIISGSNSRIKFAEVFNLLGESIEAFFFDSFSKECQIDLTSVNLANGVYTLKVLDDAGRVEVISIVISK